MGALYILLSLYGIFFGLGVLAGFTVNSRPTRKIGNFVFFTYPLGFLVGRILAYEFK